MASIPIGENPFGFLNLILGPGKAELHFASPTRDDHFDRGQTASLHSHVELFMGFMNPVALEAVHDTASVARHPKAMTNVAPQITRRAHRFSNLAGTPSAASPEFPTKVIGDDVEVVPTERRDHSFRLLSEWLTVALPAGIRDGVSYGWHVPHAGFAEAPRARRRR